MVQISQYHRNEQRRLNRMFDIVLFQMERSLYFS